MANRIWSHLELGNYWKLQTLEGTVPGERVEIKRPQLDTYTKAPYISMDGTQTYAKFRAYVGGETTSGSSYPRVELREMRNANDDVQASWTTYQGEHVMEVRGCRVHSLQSEKPQVVVGQLHLTSQDGLIVMYDKTRGRRGALVAKWFGDIDPDFLDDDLPLRQDFDFKIKAKSGFVYLFYNGVKRLKHPIRSTTAYFKTGCYNQSNPERGDDPNDYAEVWIKHPIRLAHRSESPVRDLSNWTKQ